MPPVERTGSDHRPEPGPETTLRLLAAWSVNQLEVTRPLSTNHGDALVRLAEAQGLLGPLVAAIDTGVIDLEDAAAQRAGHRHEAALWWCLMLEQRLLEIDQWFAEAGGIDYMVLKGAAVAHLDEFDPFLRSFSDLDLLIAGPCMDRALDVLVSHGDRRQEPRRRPGFEGRFGKGVNTRFDDGIEVDVHRTLCGGSHGYRIPLHRMFSMSDQFEIGGRTFNAPAKIHRALHACYHAYAWSQTPPLRTVRDIASYLCDPELPLEDLTAEARLWRGEAVLALAVKQTLLELDLDLPQWKEWLATTPVDPRERDLIERDRTPRQTPFQWSTLREIPWNDRLAFLWGVAVPSKELLRSRNQNHLTRLIAGSRRLLP